MRIGNTIKVLRNKERLPEATLNYVLGGGSFVDKQQSIMHILVLTHCAIKFQKLLEN